MSLGPLSDIEMRLNALDFFVRKLYADAIRREGGDALAVAKAARAREVGLFATQVAAVDPGTPQHERMSRTLASIERIYDEIVAAFEREQNSIA